MIVAGALLGAAFFLWIAGTRVVMPGEYGWLMQADWRIHFLGWHFFRREPWLWPPGRIDGYFHAPDGTSVGFTDAIPVAAFVFKPFDDLLPDVFQYQGLWLLTCFALQGVFGVLIARIWTKRADLQLLAAALFVLMPTLLMRVGHPSLCAHFLLLWAMWMYLRTAVTERGSIAEHGALGLVAGLVHPYLALMVLAIVAAATIRSRAPAGLVAATAAVVMGWWASGLLLGGSAEQLAAEGLGTYSMNVLSPVTPGGWSRFLPEWPHATSGQAYEGFHYFGLGVLALVLAAGALTAFRVAEAPWRHVLPLLVVAAACAVYALSPRVTFADYVLVDYSAAVPDRFAVFRATGRFFWPFAYLTLALAFAAVVTRVRALTAVSMAAAAVLLQIVDLGAGHRERRVTSRSDAFHARRLPWTSPLWAAALPHYRHLVLFNPPQCGDAPASFEWPAFLAATHGLTINAGEVARPDLEKMQRYCDELQQQMREGDLHEDSIYIVHERFVEPLKTVARVPTVCGVADGLHLCVTETSYKRWSHAMPTFPSR